MLLLCSIQQAIQLYRIKYLLYRKGYYDIEKVDSGAAAADPTVKFTNQEAEDLAFDAIKGREIYLSHDPAKFSGDGSFFAKEIEYLRQHGYKFVKEGDLWHAVQ